MLKLLAALLLAACGAAQAVTTTYAWTIDWETSPDEAGQFTFDDLGRDLSSPVMRWGWPHYSGSLPSSYGYFQPSFQDRTLVGVSVCGEPYSWCNANTAGEIPGWGYTKAGFGLRGGSSERARYDAAAGCSDGGMYFAPRCFTYETGQNTFTAVAQIPEPKTYALMLLGLGLVALRLSRNPKTAFNQKS